MKKKIVSEYLKSKESGWVYQPELKAVPSEDLVVGDVVSDLPVFIRVGSILEVVNIDLSEEGIYFNPIYGGTLYQEEEGGTIGFDIGSSGSFYKLK